jgi:hypothetical protein
MVLECLRIMWKGVVARLVVVLNNASCLLPAALPSTLPRLSLLQGPPLLIFWVIVVVAASEGANGSLVCNMRPPLLLE